MPVRFVWFDLGYTLVHNRREITYQPVLASFGYQLSAEQIRRGFHLADKHFMRQFTGVFGNGAYSPAPWFLGVAHYHMGVKADLCQAAARWEQERKPPYWVAFAEATAVLTELRRRGLGVGLISNWDHTARRVLDKAGLGGYLDPIIVSSEVGHEKPSQEIFRIALQQAGVAGAECLYVGDNYYDDAVGSRKVGMPALIINRLGTLGVEEITDCPIIQDLSQVLACLDPS